MTPEQQDYVKCADCGVTMPREAMKDGKCIDRQWCASQQCAAISESGAVREQVRVAVEAARRECYATVAKMVLSNAYRGAPEELAAVLTVWATP